MSRRHRQLVLQRYLDVAHAEDESVFRRQLVEMANAQDFPHMSAMLVAEDPLRPGRYVWRLIANPPAAYRSLSEDPARTARCPVTQLSKQRSTPFTYDQSLYLAAGAADVWEAQAPFGYRTGVATALHLPDRTHFVIGFDRWARLPSCPSRLARILANLQLLAVHAHCAAERLWKPSLQLPSPMAVHLTPREAEVMKWTLEAKTAWEVGAILKISERTAVFHISSAMRKLGTVSKHQAALKALRLGLLG